MELKQIIKIFREERRYFLKILFAVLFLGLAFFYFQPDRLVANVMLNVTRQGVQSTQDYRFDDFYRLQADERFSDTIVRWIESPGIEREILEKSDVKGAAAIKARRLSSQMIEIVFETKGEKEAKKMSDAIVEVLNNQTDMLNKDQKEDNWFLVVANKAEVIDGKVSSKLIFFATLAIGLFLSFFGVMLKHYLKD